MAAEICLASTLILLADDSSSSSGGKLLYDEKSAFESGVK